MIIATVRVVLELGLGHVSTGASGVRWDEGDDIASTVFEGDDVQRMSKERVTSTRCGQR